MEAILFEGQVGSAKCAVEIELKDWRGNAT